MVERKISRRKFLISAVSFLLPACGSLENEEQTKFPDIREKSPLAGDVVAYNGKHFLLRDNLAYEIPDFDKYKRLTKFDKYKRRMFNSLIPPAYKIERFTKENEGGLVDKYTGDWKDGKIYGGEINVFFPGFLTDGGDLHSIINPSGETFYDIRNKGLLDNHWDLADNFFFTYGDKNFNGYDAKKTALNPSTNIDKALEFFDYLKKTFPLAQFNLIGHSLGGLFALEVAKQNSDCINNLILIDSPVNGVRKTDATAQKVETFRNLIRPIIGDEYVMEYLFKRWSDKASNEEFTKLFIGSGGNLVTIASSEDLIASLESKRIKGARQITLPFAFDSPILGYLYHHGRALRDPMILKLIADIIGENETR